MTFGLFPTGTPDALAAAIGPDCAGVFLEPCLGRGRGRAGSAGYLKAARAACDASGALLVLDEIQSGIGRTGAWFACQAEGILPDVITLAKGLGGGLPIGACIGIGAAGSGFSRGDHGSTFGGNPIACAAALAVLDTIERDGLLAHVAQVGAALSAGIAATGHPLVAGVRGSGLWLAIALTAPVAASVEAAARQAGFLVNAVQPDAIRLAPPLDAERRPGQVLHRRAAGDPQPGQRAGRTGRVMDGPANAVAHPDEPAAAVAGPGGGKPVRHAQKALLTRLLQEDK